MKTEFAVDRDALIQTIRREYGLVVARLTFVPKGEVSYGYVVDCAGGDRYFLKCLDASRLGKMGASRLDFYLPVTWNLHSKGLFRNLPVPVRTRSGGFYTYFDGLPLILFHFIAGRTLDDEHPPSDATLVALARSVAAIHKSTPEIGVGNPIIERFDIPFEDDLLNGLDALKRVTRRDRWGKRTLKDLLLPRKREILGYLDRLRELQTLARTARKDVVLCHTDLWGGNLILDDCGALYILDWEGAVLAPPEHDLYPFLGERFGVFLAIYEREFRPVSLDRDIVRFYLYRRNLEDLTDWVFRILYENADDEQDRNDVRGIVEDCMSGWPYLENGISEVLDALARPAGSLPSTLR